MCVAQQVQMLTLVSNAVRASQPDHVVEVAVGRLGVTARVEAREVRVGGRDGSNVLGPVSFRAVSSGVAWSRTVTIPAPRFSEVHSPCTSRTSRTWVPRAAAAISVEKRCLPQIARNIYDLRGPPLNAVLWEPDTV